MPWHSEESRNYAIAAALDHMLEAVTDGLQYANDGGFRWEIIPFPQENFKREIHVMFDPSEDEPGAYLVIKIEEQ